MSDVMSSGLSGAIGLVGIAAALLGGCGAAAPVCARSSECSQGEACGFDGRCARFAPPEGARFAGSRWLEPLDWAIAGDARLLSDTLPIGGRSESLLAFGPVPESGQVLRALLVLRPHPGASRVREPVDVVVERVEPFRGGALPRRASAQPDAFAVARRTVDAGPGQPLRIDVTAAARAAAGRADRRLYLLLRSSGGPLRYASPFADAGRPRLELMLH